jgi:hypothetical protein
MTDEISVEQRIVRFAHRHGGPCMLLGKLIRLAAHNVIYKPNGDDTIALIPKRHIHLEPCRSCPDHPRSRYADDPVI